VTTPNYANSLLTVGDLAKFQAKDQQWFLNAVASTITDHCGWHVAPVKQVTNVVRAVGNKGIIMLPSLHVISVEQLRLNGTVVNPALYVMNTHGWIEFTGFLKPPRNLSVSVDFTHGHAATPPAVAEVGMELTADVLEKASGVVTDLTRGPTEMKFKELGVVLSDDQKKRLGPYTIVRV
jgi:hypothetical protein